MIKQQKKNSFLTHKNLPLYFNTHTLTHIYNLHMKGNTNFETQIEILILYNMNNLGKYFNFTRLFQGTYCNIFLRFV